MAEIISPRGWLALGIVILTAGIIAATGAGFDAAGLTLVGGTAAVLATTAREATEEKAARAPVDTASVGEPDLVLDALAEPVLVLGGPRILAANRAARELLGDHIIGEDARTAIRHPAAAAVLAGTSDGEPLRSRGSGRPISGGTCASPRSATGA